MEEAVGLFGEEYNLIKKILNKENKENILNEFGNYFSEGDVNVYEGELREGPLKILWKLPRWCGPYVIDKRQLEDVINRIIDISLKENLEVASLMLVDRTLTSKPVKIQLSEVKMGRYDECKFQLDLNPRYELIGTIHSHPEPFVEKGHIDFYRYPSPSDFLDEDENGKIALPLHGIVRPSKKIVIFYKVKAPYFEYFPQFIREIEKEKRRLYSPQGVYVVGVDIFCLKKEIKL